MHHLYTFLLSRHNFDATLTSDELSQQSIDWFEKNFLIYSENKEHWFTAIALICSDGQVLNLLPENNNLGLDAWVETISNLPENIRGRRRTR